MKVCINFMLLSLLICACNSSSNSASDQKKSDTVIVYKHDTVRYCLPYASISRVNDGYVSKSDLLNTNGMLLLNNELGYKIISFECTKRQMGHIFKVENYGAKINDKLIDLFSKVIMSDILSFDKIKVVSANKDTAFLNPVIIKIGWIEMEN